MIASKDRRSIRLPQLAYGLRETAQRMNIELADYRRVSRQLRLLLLE